jgi:hypothetical protein
MSPERLLPANPDILDGVEDLIQMSYLNEPSVLYNLQLRYSRDLIYVSTVQLSDYVNMWSDLSSFAFLLTVDKSRTCFNCCQSIKRSCAIWESFHHAVQAKDQR